MNKSNDRWKKENRQLELAKRMIQQEARTQVVVDWTGLTIYTVQTIFRQYPDTNAARPRGISPFQPSIFSRTRRHRRESATLASIALDMQIIVDRGEEAARKLPGLDRGERLLNAFELFREYVPASALRFEHAILLVTELTRGSAIAIDRCRSCYGLIVVDRITRPLNNCGFCRIKNQTPDLQYAT